jgi:hypothetical protein
MEYAIPRSPRYPFIAIAEIIHPESGGILGSRVAKINLNGCYVDTSKTIPAGSKVVIKIFAESECFAATAKVVYANFCNAGSYGYTLPTSGDYL